MSIHADFRTLGRPAAAASRPHGSSWQAQPAIDVALGLLATLAAFGLRFDGATPTGGAASLLAMLAFMTTLKVVAGHALGLHRQSWTRFAFEDARRVMLAAVAVGASGALLTAIVQGIARVPLGLPLTVPLLDGLLTGVFLLAARGAARHLAEARTARAVPGRPLREVLLIGAGEAGSMMAREMLRHPETGLHPMGFLDDDPGKHGRTIASVPVLGTLADLDRVLTTERVDEVLICIPSADGQAVRRIVDRIRQTRPDLPYRTMPAIYELLSGQVTVNRIRDVGIEDLLRRPPVELHTDAIYGYLRGKRVMVTGAGGSIGSELIRQICRFAPGELILFGHGENSIYQLERELDRDWPGVPYHSVIAAVQNVQRLEYVFRRYKPDVVFHTAAHKHVPLMELNPEEAVFNNVIGTRNLVRLALRYGVSHFVNVSTDKAVKPSSVMGASKRMAELVVQDAARDAEPGQTFLSVRFGNVLGSRGSALLVFKDQIRAGGPVTVTHPDMLRYFMTIPEATRLVLQASARGHNGEIYILDMGEPVRVLDIVKDLIRLSGLEPDVDIPIVFTGIRPGEKLVEELMTPEEQRGRTEHEKIFVAAPQPISRPALERTLEELVEAAMRSDGAAIRRVFSQHIDGATLAPRILESGSAEGRAPSPLAN